MNHKDVWTEESIYQPIFAAVVRRYSKEANVEIRPSSSTPISAATTKIYGHLLLFLCCARLFVICCCVN